MQVMIDNSGAMVETTAVVTNFAGALFLLAAALAAVTFTGLAALPILTGLGYAGGAALGLFSIAGGMGGKEEGEGEKTRDLYDQLVVMNEKLEALTENFQKHWVPAIVDSNIEGAEKGAKASTRAAIGIGT